MNKKVVVVGSGIAGITAAYFEAKKGNIVTLIDSDARAGGLLKSDFSHGQYFDYGTHIFSKTNIEVLNNFLYSDLNDDNCVITKKIIAGNYFNGVINEKNGCIDTSLLPKNKFDKGCLELLVAQANDKDDNLESFLINKIGPTFYNEILKKVIQKYMGVDASDLAIQVGNFFDMSRVLAFNDTTTKQLTKLDIYSKKLGHHTRKDGIIKYYPKQGGIGKIIELLINKLKKQGVTFKFSTQITSILEKDGNVSAIVTKDETLKVDKLIWTLPSSFLMHLTGLKKKTSPPKFRNTGLYDFTFKKPLLSKATYINVYDADLLSGRVTLYQNLSKQNKYSCTVEVLTDTGVELGSLVDDIKLELIKMGVVDKNNQCTFKQFRPIKNGFPILTTQFVEEQSQLNNFCEDHFNNVLFVGRATSKVFFMDEVLINAYQKITND